MYAAFFELKDAKEEIEHLKITIEDLEATANSYMTDANAAEAELEKLKDNAEYYLNSIKESAQTAMEELDITKGTLRGW